MEAWDQSLRGTRRNRSSSRLGVKGAADLPTAPAYALKPGYPTPGRPTLLRHPFSQTLTRWFRNIDRISITYAFRPRLRDRLTLRRLALLRKPWIYGERVSHPFIATYVCISSSRTSSGSYDPPSQATGMLPYHRPSAEAPSQSAASVSCLSPVTFSAQTHLTSELLRFL